MRPHQALTLLSRADARWRSVVGLALLVAALVGLSLASSRAAFQEPNYSMAIDRARCSRAGPDGAVAMAERWEYLPFAAPWAERYARTVTHCRFDLDLTADEIGNAALLIPSFTDALTITVNGQRVAVAELYVMRNLRFTTMPAFVPLSGSVLAKGRNRFTVTLSALPGRAAALDRIFVGAASELRPYYHSRWFAAAVLPTLVVGGEVALAIIFALIWAARPRKAEFGWLAVTLALGAARGSVIMPDFGVAGSGHPFWNMLVVWEIAAALMFCRALVGAPVTRRTWLFAGPPLLLTMIYVLGPNRDVPSGVLLAVMLLFFVYMGIAIWGLARAALHGSGEALVVMFGILVLVIFSARDTLSILGPDPSRVFLARSVYGGFLLATATLMTARFVRAMREQDNIAETLRDRVATVERELRDTYEELRARREAEAVDRERRRLMRDLHDGLGGELASMLALADAPRPHTQEIARHARAALADMRLIIGSLDDYGGDLLLALGTWRERVEPQLRASGLRLIWDVRDLPPLDGLGPAQVLDILRILQEAVTNVIKHAGAMRVTLAAFEDGDAVVLAISDDGAGFDPQAGGSGIRNMRMRAGRLNATLAIGRDGQATQMRLRLPRSFAALS